MGSVLALALQAKPPSGLREWLVAPRNEMLYPLAAVVAGMALWGLWMGRRNRGGSPADPPPNGASNAPQG